MNSVKEYWKADDALMHSEIGVPGAMSADMIRKYIGDQQLLPANRENPYWNRFNWWIEWKDFLKRRNNQSSKITLEEYVNWSQKRQAEGLKIALKASKEKFPKTGGFLIWMGHDSFPAPINTSIMDFEGNFKPVAKELKKILKSE
jgi:beta-mannosidase